MKRIVAILLVVVIGTGVSKLWDNFSFGGYKMTNEIIEKVKAEDTPYTYYFSSSFEDETIEFNVEFTGEEIKIASEDIVYAKGDEGYTEFIDIIVEDLKMTRESYKTGIEATITENDTSFLAKGRTESDSSYNAEVAKDGSFATEKNVFDNGMNYEYRLEFKE